MGGSSAAPGGVAGGGHDENAEPPSSPRPQIEPTNVNAFFNRGSAYDSIGNYDLAVQDYSRALDLDAGTNASNTPRMGTPGIGTTPSLTPASTTPAGTPRASVGGR